MINGLYTGDEVLGILANLVNGIGLCAKGDFMPARYKQKVHLNGEDHWVTGKTLSDILEAYLNLCLQEGTVVPGIVSKEDNKDADTPTVGEYIDTFVKLYKQKQQSLTKESRDRVIRNHIKPKFGKTRLSDLSVSGIQDWMNELDAKGYSHETLLKIKNTMSPALDSAVEDGYMKRNPFRSSRLVIAGKPTEHHKAIPQEKMNAIREVIPEITDVRIRSMLALLSYTGMRMEEVLGLRWEDLDFEEGWIHIRRAVVHPGRNLGEIKPPKSKTSERKIPLPKDLVRYLAPKYNKGFVLYSYSDTTRETPMSYTEARRVFQKIREYCDLNGYSAHDFRDTCATEWREAGIPVDVIAHLLGHSKSDITENRYVKYRDELYQGVRAVMNDPNGTKTETKSQR